MQRWGATWAPVRRRRFDIFRDSLALAHGFLAFDDEAVGIMDNAVTDDIGEDWIANLILPAAYVELGAEDGHNVPS